MAAKRRARTPRRGRRRYHSLRRVPQAYPGIYLRLRLAPIIPGIAATIAVGAAADAQFLPEGARQWARARADAMGGAISEEAQKVFFDQPGLDTLVVRSLAHAARRLASLGRLWARAAIAVGRDRDGRLAASLPLIPRRGYDTLMTGMLTVGTAVGVWRGGGVNTRIIRDSAADPAMLEPPEGHPEAQIRRAAPPESLADLCADIDELYWAATTGAVIKICRVGTGGARRWLVSMVGTESMRFGSTHNPADIEVNIRLMLGLDSAMGVGLVAALHRAMAADSVPEEQWSSEPVLVCGHSQGGLVASVLASRDPAEAGVNVVGILSTGAPNRRVAVRPDVTIVTVAHDQDVVPSMDGSPDRSPDRRVTVGRTLVRPRKRPLYYAHSSATYTETVRLMERRAAVTPWDRLGKAVATLRAMLPAPGEEVRVTHHEIWQDLLEPTAVSTWNTVASLERADPRAVTYPIDYEGARSISATARGIGAVWRALRNKALRGVKGL